MRSEYFAGNDALPNRNDLSKRLIILPEILTVTCKSSELNDPIGDGFQLRDLSRLDPKCRYFPFFSIPYVGKGTTAAKVNLDKYALRFSGMEEPEKPVPGVATSLEWSVHWTANYAAALGRTKAILHLCYDLQPLTPNAQNFLLELNAKDEPTGRVVVRDLLDMKLHSDWLSTTFGNSDVSTSMTQINFAASKFGDTLVKAVLKYQSCLERNPKPSRMYSTRRGSFSTSKGRS